MALVGIGESDGVEVSIVLPCLNEEGPLAGCIHNARHALEQMEAPGEILVADNDSTDRSRQIAEELGARVVRARRRGYGSALIEGCSAARGRYIVMGDADGSYDFTEAVPMVERLRDGYEVVMGSRLKGHVLPGAMPWKNRWIGNPILSGILNLFFRSGLSDVHCGLRAFTKASYQKMGLRCLGMEFASEMVVKATLLDLPRTEIPITLRPDKRNRRSHLKPLRDGWRHLKFMLCFSPLFLFILPGAFMMALGLALLLGLYLTPEHVPLRIGGLPFGDHWTIVGMTLFALGYQVILLGVFTHIYSVTHRLTLPSRWLDKAFGYIRLETALTIGAAATLLGLLMEVHLVYQWIQVEFGELRGFRTGMLGATLIVFGVQTIFAGFFLSILGDEYGRRSRQTATKSNRYRDRG